jgi:hypothetical protein
LLIASARVALGALPPKLFPTPLANTGAPVADCLGGILVPRSRPFSQLLLQCGGLNWGGF